LIERGEEKVLEEVPPLMGTSLAWNPDEVRFEYRPQGLPTNWIWKPRERMVYDPVHNDNVAQWNPEASSWNMNPPPPEPAPTPEPGNWTYLEGVEHVKFAEFNQEQLQILKEAADSVKQYDPERFALFEKEIDWVIFSPEEEFDWGAYYSESGIHIVEEGCLFRAHGHGALSVLELAALVWGHEFQHHIQHMEGRDSAGCKENEREAFRAAKELIQKMRSAIPQEDQFIVDNIIKYKFDPVIAWRIPYLPCLTGPEPQVQSDFTAAFENILDKCTALYAVFRIQNTGGVTLHTMRLRIENLSGGDDLFPSLYLICALFSANASDCLRNDTLEVGATAYISAFLSEMPPSGTQARAHITLCTQEWGVDCTTRTVDFIVH